MAAIAVIGGDVHGLVAACELIACGHSVTVFGFDSPAQSVVLPGFKFLERTTEVREFLDRLGLVYETYTVSVGLMRHGSIESLRKTFSPEVYFALYRKTRLTRPPDSAPLVMDDPEAGSLKHAIALDWINFARMIYNEVVADFRRVNSVVAPGEGKLLLPDGRDFKFDGFVSAVPLWQAAEIFRGLVLPDAMATKLQYVCVNAVRDAYVKWDVVYTPYTPGSTIHRLYHHRELGFVCEFSGELREDDLQSDLNFLFPDGWHFIDDLVFANGHLIPLAYEPRWPKTICPVGKHATWDSMAGLTKTIRDVRAFAKAMDAHA